MEKYVGTILKISGPLVVAGGMRHVRLFDVVLVGEKNLIGEVIELRGENAWAQVYEDTAGLTIGDAVRSTGEPLSMTLGPGVIGSIFDGIGRPIDAIYKEHGDHIARGITAPTINETRKWEFVAHANVGDTVSTDDILGIVKENEVITHRILVPHNVGGVIEKITSGEFNVTETIAVIEGKSVSMMQKWPVRVPRPYKRKLTPREPLVTGQRVIDSLFPIAKGGVGAIPGPFGSGKTVVQHQIAKWSDAEIVVYVGCGERGNEICDVLSEFPMLVDKRTGEPLIKRTVLIANTSDMPVSAREASIYTGLTIAEYFRDMGYNVALMADSTSRYAEALREMSGRMEELPGEEGYPAYLSSRIAGLYERAGLVETFGGSARLSGALAVEGKGKPKIGRPRHGSITMIGAVSPPGGDLSEPVAQATMRVVKTFWALSYALAHKRHFPAIDWLQSYSLYTDALAPWYAKEISPRFLDLRARTLKLLQHEAELLEIVRLVGADALSGADQEILGRAKRVREDFLHQNAFDPSDTYTPLPDQYARLKEILDEK